MPHPHPKPQLPSAGGTAGATAVLLRLQGNSQADRLEERCKGSWAGPRSAGPPPPRVGVYLGCGGSFFSLAAFCFCCMISESLEGERAFRQAAAFRKYAKDDSQADDVLGGGKAGWDAQGSCVQNSLPATLDGSGPTVTARRGRKSRVWPQL